MTVIATTPTPTYATVTQLDAAYPNISASNLTTSEKSQMICAAENMIDSLVGFYPSQETNCEESRIFPRTYDQYKTVNLGSWNPSTPPPNPMVKYGWSEISSSGTVFGALVSVGQFVIFLSSNPTTSTDVIIQNAEPKSYIGIVPYDIHLCTIKITNMFYISSFSPISGGAPGGFGGSPASWMDAGDSIHLDDFSYKKGSGSSSSSGSFGGGITNSWLKNNGSDGTLVLQILQRYSNFTLPL